MPRPRSYTFALAIPLLCAAAAYSRENAASAILERSMASYTKLQSYADSGTTVMQTGPTMYQYGSFKTFYERKGNSFFFAYHDIKAVDRGGTLPLNRHYVYWMTKGTLQKWNSEGKTHEVFPAGSTNQITPLQNGELATRGAITLVPSLIFGRAGLFGVLQEIVKISDAGTEAVNGRKCHKLVGFAQSTYPSGKTFNRRPVTVWIDAETMLIRKLLVDTPKGYATGSMYRITTTLYPQANTRIDPRSFHFKVPEPQ